MIDDSRPETIFTFVKKVFGEGCLLDFTTTIPSFIRTSARTSAGVQFLSGGTSFTLEARGSLFRTDFVKLRGGPKESDTQKEYWLSDS